jgi:hypothetical protein
VKDRCGPPSFRAGTQTRARAAKLFREKESVPPGFPRLRHCGVRPWLSRPTQRQWGGLIT